MGFLAPWFLAALAGLGLPFYLHLLRRQTTKPLPFSSLMFFEPRTQASMRHRRLKYWWLLALRLALLALLVLAFAEPYRLRSAANASGRLHVLVLDHSFSMRAGTRFADARREADAALAAVHGPVQVAALGARLEVLTQPGGDRAAQRAALDSIAPGDGHADYGELARGLRALAGQTPAGIQVDFFSDLKQSSLPASFGDLRLPANVSFVPHAAASGAAPNWTVETVQAPPQLWGSPKETKPARIEAVIAGYGTPAASRTLDLLVNGQRVGQQRVAVPASGRVTAVFDAVVIPYGWSRCQAVIEETDAFAADNTGIFSIYRADPERVLLVHGAGDTRSPLYFSDALGAGADDAFQVESVSAGAAADRQPGHYPLVVLADVPSLPAAFDTALTKYVQGGGGVLITAGVATHQVPFFELTGGRNYSVSPAYSLAPGWEGARIFYAAQVAPGDARVLARLNDQSPLLLEKNVGEGRVELLASGLDNLTNDFPLQPGFVPFVRQTASFLAGDTDSAGGSRLVDSFLTLRSAKEQGIGVQLTDPAGGHPLTLEQAERAQTALLPMAGFYQLKLANGREQVVAVNPDRRESALAPIPAETLALWRGGCHAGEAGCSPAAAAGSVPGEEKVPLWWYIMLVLLAVTVIESVVAARYLAVRRDEEKVLQEVS